MAEKITEKISEKFDNYEAISVTGAGAALLLGAMFLFPHIRLLFGKDGVDLGGLGLFLVAAFILGQLLHGLGAFVEQWMWARGMPSDWVLDKDQTFIGKSQRDKLRDIAQRRMGVDIDTLAQDPEKYQKWASYTRQVYTVVQSANRSGRVDAFNRTYGLCLGLGVAMVLLAGAALVGAGRWFLALLLLGAAGVAFNRMYDFGLRYARELLITYITLDGVAPAPAKPAVTPPSPSPAA